LTAEQLAHKISDLFPAPHTDQKVFDMILPVCEEVAKDIAEAVAAFEDLNFYKDWMMSTAPGTHITVPTAKLRRLMLALEKLK